MKTQAKGPFLGINNRKPDYALHVDKTGDFLRDALNVDLDNVGKRIGDGIVRVVGAGAGIVNDPWASGVKYKGGKSEAEALIIAEYKKAPTAEGVKTALAGGRVGRPSDVALKLAMTTAMDGDFDTDSIVYKVRHVFGGVALDAKGVVASNGTGS